MALNDAKQYRIGVDANLNINQQQTAIPTQTAQGIGTIPNQQSRGISAGSAISLQFAVEQGSRLLNATGNQEIANAVSTTGRYAFLGARAIAGDPTAQITLMIMAVSKLLETVKKQAEELNEIDTARIKSGLMNVEGLRVNKNFLTGRTYYSRD